MKTKTCFKLIAILVIAMVVSTNCKKDDDPVNPHTSYLFDKWWYASNGYSPDLYFHSNGVFEQKAILLGQEVNSTGSWSWVDESKGIMKITCTEWPFPDLWLKFSDITETTYALQQSDDGSDYTDKFYYKDTKDIL